MRTSLLLALLAAPAAAGDWPQLLGPNRDGVAVGEAPLTALPDAAAPLWTAPAGEGFAGPAVVGGVAYLFHRPGGVERLEARDAATGERLWKSDAPSNYDRPGFIADRGPRAAPVVTDPALLNEPAARVLALGAGGLLRCVNAATGEEFWRHEVAEEFGGDLGYFGLGSSPLVCPRIGGNGGPDGAIVLVVAGGFRQRAGVVGLDLETGTTRWTAADVKPCYSSPILLRTFGRADPPGPIAVVPTRVTTFGVDPLTGAVKWRVPFGARGPTAIGANPIALPTAPDASRRPVFLTSAYSTGDLLVKAGPDGAETLYKGGAVCRSQYATPIGFGGPLLWGLNGQESRGPAAFVCFDPVTREVKWEEGGVGLGLLLGVPGEEPGGGTILKLGLDGELILFAADPEGYREFGRLDLFPRGESTVETRAAPAYSGGVLFARDAGTFQAVRLTE